MNSINYIQYERSAFLCISQLNCSFYEIKSKSNLNLSWIINKNCNWLLCISHRERFVIIEKKSISVLFPKLCLLNRHQFLLLFDLINASFSAVLITATLMTRALSLPTLFLVAFFLVRCFLHLHWSWNPSCFQWFRLLLSCRLASGFEEFLCSIKGWVM